MCRAIAHVHCGGTKGLDFDTAIVADAGSDSDIGPMTAPMSVAYYVMITSTRERLVSAWPGSRMPWHQA